MPAQTTASLASSANARSTRANTPARHNRTNIRRSLLGVSGVSAITRSVLCAFAARSLSSRATTTTVVAAAASGGHCRAMSATTEIATNPLTSKFSRETGYFPPFESIKPEHVVPGIRALLAESEQKLESLEKTATPTWDGVMAPLEELTDRLGVAWGAVKHLKSVRDNEELRTAVDEVQPERVKLSLRISQSEALYKAIKSLREDEAQWSGLSNAQKRAVDAELKDFELGGVGLTGDAKEEFNAIQQKMSSISTTFSNNLLDATKAYMKVVTSKDDVDGLPPSALAAAAAAARDRGGHPEATAESGPWALTLDMPVYLPVMQHLKKRELREEVYRASITRASKPAEGKEGAVAGEDGVLKNGDNTPLILETLRLRKRKAALLGYDDHCSVSMAKKMATPETAFALLEDLRVKSMSYASKELEDLKEYAKANGGPDDLKHWDMPFWAERLREAQYSFTEEDLRPYLPLPAVLDGLFSLLNKLFDIEVKPTTQNLEKPHPDVQIFDVFRDGAVVAHFYLDPYARPAEKRGGAWMDEVFARSSLFGSEPGTCRLPVAHMVCNQTPPVDGKPSLMTFREVETLFHEAGHAFQHMLTKVDCGLCSGIRNVEWDAVELPSQFMENWCYHRATLMSFAKHYETGEPLPDDLFDKIVAARTFRAGSMMMRQLHFATVDLSLHSAAHFDPESGDASKIFELEQKVAEKTCVVMPLPEDRFLCGFAHIFAGGYSAGYFSYKWAEVLSADAFGAFEEAGLEDDEAVKSTGRLFADTVMGLGGSLPPMEVFTKFRGREPTTDALLRHSGLVAASA
mmetsp:Transcript_12715/g.28855  ORF Transcript_12715/g.28855 Transcript_12715/m.28855 type:complete len:804 (-) Transcript_12715:651-3062(-)